MVDKAAAKASRKLKDKWRMKDWYSIIAPEMFNRAKIGETLSDDPKKLMDRIIEITAQDLTGDFTKMHIKLHFKVEDVKNQEAHTYFYKQELTSDYERRLARRKRTRIEGTFDVTTRDKVRLKVKPMAITEQRISSSKQSTIRQIMREELKKGASETLLQDFIRDIIAGQLQRKIVQACKPIHLVQRVEIRKTEFVGQEKVEADEVIAGEEEVAEEIEEPPKEEEGEATEEIPEVEEKEEPAEPAKIEEPEQEESLDIEDEAVQTEDEEESPEKEEKE